MKVFFFQTIILLASFAHCHGSGKEVQDVSNQENGRNGDGYLRTRNLAKCPYTMGTPCWGVQVCRLNFNGKRSTKCLPPNAVLTSDECGKCTNNNNDEETVGDANPQEVENQDENSDVNTGTTSDKENGNSDVAVNNGGVADTINEGDNQNLIIPNAANCPFSQKSPCVGVPVCRSGKSMCIDADYVRTSDQCGYCDDNDDEEEESNNDGGGRNPQEDENIEEAEQENLYISNAANCPFSQRSPCFGVPVCRSVKGVATSMCLSAGYVRPSDQCGNCDDEA